MNLPNIKKDELAFTELLQVRVSIIVKRKIDKYVKEVRERTGIRYSQSDFLRETIMSKLTGEFEDIEDRVIAGAIIGEQVKEGRKKGIITKETLLGALGEILNRDGQLDKIYRDIEEKDKIKREKIYQDIEKKDRLKWSKFQKHLIEGIKSLEQIPDESREKIVNEIEKIE